MSAAAGVSVDDIDRRHESVVRGCNVENFVVVVKESADIGMSGGDTWAGGIGMNDLAAEAEAASALA